MTEEAKKLTEKLDAFKNRRPGTFEIYNYDMLRYLRNKFPEEPEEKLQEAAAYISYRTAIVVQDLNNELSREWEKAFNELKRKAVIEK